MTECKLRIHGELSFGLAGIPYDRQSGYDVEAITRSVFSAPGDFRQHVEVLKGRLLQALRWEIRQLKDKDPQMYRWAIRRGEEPLMLALAVVERRIPRLAVLGYQLDWNTEPPGVNVRETIAPATVMTVVMPTTLERLPRLMPSSQPGRRSSSPTCPISSS